MSQPGVMLALPLQIPLIMPGLRGRPEIGVANLSLSPDHTTLILRASLRGLGHVEGMIPLPTLVLAVNDGDPSGIPDPADG